MFLNRGRSALPIPVVISSLCLEMERELGDQTFKAILAEHAGRILPPTHPKAKMVKYVGQRIANAAKQNDFKWEFVTIDSPEANAFCIPGGKVCVFTGIFKMFEDWEKQHLGSSLTYFSTHPPNAERYTLLR
ncbi:hypothetical protein DYB38_013868 [Aphanomyces astaci]|uniref:Peptidase M48 domain-containing protein n=1 Tax=Aphanomyces astaci TaxID=112090 RepID=A0A397CMK4_APHAT|nr:hypothetical protein DYB38_013868 [Aphanomyces astaci]